ncbi:hypothetical protein [Roseivirga sp.]|uniref:hypothetical protein n=1 Tax=Roseivirga sp. TaxID=1964215 RepID=UPI003B517CA8
MRNLSIIIILALLVGCNVRPEDNVTTDSYFNLEKLLNQEIEYLLSQNAGLEKSLTSNGIRENTNFQPQTKDDWESQLSLFFDANIDKPGYKGAFYEEQLSPLSGVSKTIYTAKSSKTAVRTFECLYSDDLLSQINIQIGEKNMIFTSLKTLKLYFDPNGEHIIGFDVEGQENMQLKEDMEYSIQAVITY